MTKNTQEPDGRITFYQQADNDAHFEEVLSQCGTGYRMQIRRIKPTWCDGLVDTWELDSNEPIDLEDVREACGGRKLQLVIIDAAGKWQASRMVKFPDAPRSDGQLCKREDDEHPNAPSNGAAGMKDIVAMLLDSQRQNSEIMRGMMDSRLAALESRAAAPAALAAAPAAAADPMKAIRESIDTIKQIEELRAGLGFGSDGAAAPAEPTLYEKMIQDFFNLQMEREKAKVAQATAAAREASKPPPELPERRKAGGEGSAPAAAPAKPQTLQGAKANLDTIDDLTLAAILSDRYKAMGPEQREKALAVFMGQYQWVDEGEEPSDAALDGDEDDEDDPADSCQISKNNVVDLSTRPAQDQGGGITISASDRAILDGKPTP